MSIGVEPAANRNEATPRRRNSRRTAIARKLEVLFMQSVAHTSTPFAVHASLMTFFDRDGIEVHVAYNRRASEGPGASVTDVLAGIPGVTLLPIEFGPRVGGMPKTKVAAESGASLVPALRDFGRLVRHVRKHGIDIIHCSEAPRDAFYGLWLARIAGAKCVVQMHVKYNDWISPLSRWAIRHADGIIGVSGYASHHVRQAGVSPDRIFTVYNGIDVSGWDPATTDGSKIRREFGVDHETALLVSVGNIHPWKRHAMLLDALRAAVQTHPKAKLIIVGKEEAHVKGLRSGSHTEQLKRQVRESELERHVVFAGQRRDVPQILAAADIFAMPAYEEPFGNVFLEAMAMENPIVALRSGGTPEVVEDGKAGLLSPADDRDALAKNITALLEDRELRMQMGAYGRRRVLERFTANHMCDGVEGVYRALATR